MRLIRLKKIPDPGLTLLRYTGTGIKGYGMAFDSFMET